MIIIIILCISLKLWVNPKSKQIEFGEQDDRRLRSPPKKKKKKKELANKFGQLVRPKYRLELEVHLYPLLLEKVVCL
jgi:hypothetical protein